MNIRYLGHSSFLLTSDAGTRIVTDPFGAIGYPFPCVEADFVTVSHGHYDHCNVSAVGGSPAVADRAGHYRMGDVEATAIRRFHDEVHGRKRGEDLVFLFQFGGLRVCHLGDIGEPCSDEIVRLLSPVDVLFVPVGGNYTVGAEGAKAYVDALAPSAVIPMHFKTARLNVDISGPEAFLAQWSGAIHAGSSLDLTPQTLCGQTKIYLMERVK